MNCTMMHGSMNIKLSNSRKVIHETNKHEVLALGYQTIRTGVQRKYFIHLTDH